jgi:hypothetical protein
VYSSVTCHSVLAEETSRRRSGEPHRLVDYLHCRHHVTTAFRHAAPRQDIELCRGSERVNVTSTPHSSSFSSLDPTFDFATTTIPTTRTHVLPPILFR